MREISLVRYFCSPHFLFSLIRLWWNPLCPEMTAKLLLSIFWQFDRIFYILHLTSAPLIHFLTITKIKLKLLIKNSYFQGPDTIFIQYFLTFSSLYLILSYYQTVYSLLFDLLVFKLSSLVLEFCLDFYQFLNLMLMCFTSRRFA